MENEGRNRICSRKLMINVKLILSSQVHVSIFAGNKCHELKFLTKTSLLCRQSILWQKHFLTAAQYKPNTNDRSTRFPYLPNFISKIIRHFHGNALEGIFRDSSAHLYPHLLRLYSQHSSFSWNESKWALWCLIFVLQPLVCVLGRSDSVRHGRAHVI